MQSDHRKTTPLVPTILGSMYDNYGCVTPKKIDDKTIIVKSMAYNRAQLINLIFNSINDLVEYSREAKTELTQSQTINLALVVLRKQRVFKDYIRACKRNNTA